ncbi:hypothetical protein TNCV_437871 [Trichonephila clavipes]|nr:hypothetical protein TNCV_437871 [Trichonephila clavipes]
MESHTLYKGIRTYLVDSGYVYIWKFSDNTPTSLEGTSLKIVGFSFGVWGILWDITLDTYTDIHCFLSVILFGSYWSSFFLFIDGSATFHIGLFHCRTVVGKPKYPTCELSEKSPVQNPIRQIWDFLA